jgi:sialate O-acetylesterase
MVRPLVWQSIKGVLWYQGEGNRGNAEQYQELLSVLMTDWRAHWRNSSLPFVIMQLPGFGTPAAAFDADSAWAAVRDAQRRAVASSQPAGLVVSIDFGDGTIHPGAKLPFGRRAANVAFGLVYEQGSRERIPMPTALSFEKAAATVEFDQGRACLEATPYLSEMVFIAGDDHRWRVAEVSVGRSSLVARSTQVSRPVAVRYAWSDYPRVGLRTCGERVPVTPFRTDDWR